MDLLDLLSSETPPRAPWGVAIAPGIVEDNAQEEKKGLLKVKIPMLEADHNLLDGVRVVTPYGGESWGSYFLPEVGDEVLVLFPNGPYGQAYVIGCLYRQDNAFQKGCYEEKNNVKNITTRGGVKLAISDEDDRQSISIATPKPLSIKLEDENGTITVQGADDATSIVLDIKNRKLKIKAEEEFSLTCGKASLTMKKDGTIELSGGSGDVKISGQNAKISGTSSAELSGQQVTVKGQNSAKMSGQSSAEVSSSGITRIKGQMVKLN